MKLTGEQLHNVLKASLDDLCNEAQITNRLCGQQIVPSDTWATLTDSERHAAVQAYLNELAATGSEQMRAAITRATFERATHLFQLAFVEERKMQA